MISAYPGERARILQPDGWQEGHSDGSTVTFKNSDYIWFHGFEVEGGWRRGSPQNIGSNRSCIRVEANQEENLRVINNLCFRAFDIGIHVNGGHPRGIIVEGNIIWECGFPWFGRGISIDGFDANSGSVIVRGNFVLNCGGGIDFNYARGAACYNNVATSVATVGSGFVQNVSGNTIANNVWVGNLAAGMMIQGKSETNVIVNNIFSDNSPRHLLMNDSFGLLDGTTLGNVLDYCLFDPKSELASPLSWFKPWLGTHLLNADPLFIDPLRFDFRLQPNSPARKVAGPINLRGARPYER